MHSRGLRPLLLGLLAFMLIATPLAGAQEDAEELLTGPARVTIEVYLGPGSGGDTFTITPESMTVEPDTVVTFHVQNVGGTDHDFALLGEGFESDEEDQQTREDGNGEAVKTPLLAPGETYNLTVTFGPDFSGSVTYICSVGGHADLGMEGTLNVGVSAADEEEITDFGVDYLAYWIGIASFVILFIVLFATFFYFRYGETKQAVDHRTGGPATITVAAGSTEGETREIVQPLLPSPGQVVKVLVILTLIGLAFWYLM